MKHNAGSEGVTAEYSDTEQEIIALVAMCHLIDDMANYAMFASGWTPDWTNVLFETKAHARLFNILLVDFLSAPKPWKKPRKGSKPFDLPVSDGSQHATERATDKTYLFILRKIVNDPKLNPNSAELNQAVERFSAWLEDDTFIEKVWFPSIELELDMKVRRIDALKITGDITKHNFTRLGAVVSKLKKLFEKNNTNVTEIQCYQLLPEFQQWFQDHVFMYQSSHIIEFLVTIRCAIHDYLRYEYERCREVWFDERLQLENYKYHAPNGVQHPFAIHMHWELMNLVRSGPIIRGYQAGPHMKAGLSHG